MNVIIFILILFILVLVHEYGHYIFAKRFGIRVDEFGFGYPPRALKLFRRGETLFTLNWLPFGGFVKIFGENPTDETLSTEDTSRHFSSKPKYAQALVLFAGILFNFLLAWLLFSVGLMTGLPASTSDTTYPGAIHNAKLTIIDVQKGSPAEISGLVTGDQIVSLESEKDQLLNPNTETVRDFIQTHGTKTVTLDYVRGSEMHAATLTPKEGLVENRFAIGISMDTIGTIKMSVPRALVEGFKTSWHTVVTILSYLGNLIHDSLFGKPDLSAIAGPVGIVSVVGQAAKFGFVYLLSLVATISANLAVINLLPFPALDGGRLFFLLIEVVTRRKVPVKAFMIANTVGFFILIGLMVLVTYHDIAKLVISR